MRNLAPFIVLVVSLFIGFTSQAETTFDLEVYRATGWDQATCQTRFGSHYWDPSFGQCGACLCHPNAFPLYEARVDACLSIDTWLDYQKTFGLVPAAKLPDCSAKAKAGGSGESDASYPCRDCDGDGYSFEHDCDDWSYAIYPGAPEVANNRVDEDCDGEDLLTTEEPAPVLEEKSKENSDEPKSQPAHESTTTTNPDPDPDPEAEPRPEPTGSNLLEEAGIDASFEKLAPSLYTVGPGQMREYGGFKMRTASGTDNVYVTEEDGNHVLELMVGRERDEQNPLNAVLVMPGIELVENGQYLFSFRYRALAEFKLQLAVYPSGEEPLGAPYITEVSILPSPDNWHDVSMNLDPGLPEGTYDLALGWANVRERLLVLDRLFLAQKLD